MEQRLIDANEIRWADHYDSDGNLSKYKVAYSDEMPPTIDAVPVRRGKWITCTSSEHWKCSECGCRAGYWLNEENSGIESWERDFSEWLSDYCPACGARMDAERKEE